VLSGKAVVITGEGRGIGRAIAIGVADDGVAGDRFGVEETPVGGETDLPQGGQVAQPLKVVYRREQ
jgi:NAD(P)-dependent dehydrogenase (short-subunit alcohol dehydrogenase family)